MWPTLIIVQNGKKLVGEINWGFGKNICLVVFVVEYCPMVVIRKTTLSTVLLCGYYRYMIVIITSYLQTHRRWRNKRVSTSSVIRTILFSLIVLNNIVRNNSITTTPHIFVYIGQPQSFFFFLHFVFFLSIFTCFPSHFLDKIKKGKKKQPEMLLKDIHDSSKRVDC